MPFRFLNSKKEKHERLKKKSKSTTDMVEIGKILAPENNLMSSQSSKEMKTKSKSRLSLFSKNHNYDSLKDIKNNNEMNVTSSNGLMVSNKRGSKMCYLSVGPDNGQIISLSSSDNCLNNNNYVRSERATLYKRSASCCGITDSTNRERRMSDLAQLDLYIEYHQRRIADDGSNAKRLVCAQLLRQSFLKLEQMRHNDSLRPQEKPDKTTNLNNTLSSANLNQFKKSKVNSANHRRRCSYWGYSVQLQEHRLSFPDQNRRGSWMSVDSDERVDDGPDKCASNPDIKIEFVDSEHNNGREDDPLDISIAHDFFKKPKFMFKRRSVPTLTAPEIEIF